MDLEMPSEFGNVYGAVYDPPAPGLPLVLVIFDAEGSVMAAKSVDSREIGERLLYDLMEEQAAASQSVMSSRRYTTDQ